MYHCVSSEIISGDIPVKVFGWGAADAVRPHQTTYLVVVVPSSGSSILAVSG